MTVVVGYVPTPVGKAAVHAAIEEARIRAAKLIVVNSSTGGAYVDRSLAPDDDLDKIRELSAEGGVDVEIRQVPTGQSPSDEILDVVDAEAASLLVIGLRRRSPVGKLFLGSTAQELLLNADCPVLSVKPEG